MTWRFATARRKSPFYDGALAVVVWAAARALQLRIAGMGWGSDVARYAWFARSWGAGAVPYLDFHPEYPPGALPLFLLPWLVGGNAGYARSFAMEMAAFDVAALLMVLAVARRLHPGSAARQGGAVMGYILFTAALYPVLYSRFDIVPAALVMAALQLTYSGSPSAGAVVLGAAGAMKVWPFLLVPFALHLAFRRRGWVAVWRTGGLLALGALVPALPFLPRAGLGVLGFFRFHGARGIQLESTWATIALALHDAGAFPVQVDDRFGAIHLGGAAASVFALASGPVLVILAMAPQLLAMRAWPGQDGDEGMRAGYTVAAAAVSGALLGGKVLSPQYLIWLAPLWAVVLGPPLVLGAFAAAVLTTAIYPYLWQPLLRAGPMHGVALAVLATRNLLVGCIYAVLLWRLAGRPPPHLRLASSAVPSDVPSAAREDSAGA